MAPCWIYDLRVHTYLRVPVVNSPITACEVVLRGRVTGATEVAEAEHGAQVLPHEELYALARLQDLQKGTVGGGVGMAAAEWGRVAQLALWRDRRPSECLSFPNPPRAPPKPPNPPDRYLDDLEDL